MKNNLKLNLTIVFIGFNKKKNMRHKFYKEDDIWYIDLPNYPGDKSDLAMVMGADTMLDLISNFGDKVILDISTSDDENLIKYSNKLIYISDAKDVMGEGAYYLLNNNNEPTIQIWLCDVTKFVFSDFPKVIYFEKVESIDVTFN